jgi:hypothetical protein
MGRVEKKRLFHFFFSSSSCFLYGFWLIIFLFSLRLVLVLSIDKMSSISSVELWAAAKFIGRECASVNKDYILCKQQSGANPAACAQQGELATACATQV